MPDVATPQRTGRPSRGSRQVKDRQRGAVGTRVVDGHRPELPGSAAHGEIAVGVDHGARPRGEQVEASIGEPALGDASEVEADPRRRGARPPSDAGRARWTSPRGATPAAGASASPSAARRASSRAMSTRPPLSSAAIQPGAQDGPQRRADGHDRARIGIQGGQLGSIEVPAQAVGPPGDPWRPPARSASRRRTNRRIWMSPARRPMSTTCRSSPGTVHAALGLSPLAHGRLLAIDLATLRAQAGVLDVIAAADIAGSNDCGPIVHDDPILADGVVRYAGQPVFAVIAHSRDAARRAAPPA